MNAVHAIDQIERELNKRHEHIMGIMRALRVLAEDKEGQGTIAQLIAAELKRGGPMRARNIASGIGYDVAVVRAVLNQNEGTLFMAERSGTHKTLWRNAQ